MGILFNSTALGIHFCETSLIFNFKTRLGGEICLCDVNMHKSYLISQQSRNLSVTKYTHIKISCDKVTFDMGYDLMFAV